MQTGVLNLHRQGTGQETGQGPGMWDYLSDHIGARMDFRAAFKGVHDPMERLNIAQGIFRHWHGRGISPRRTTMLHLAGAEIARCVSVGLSIPPQQPTLEIAHDSRQ
ncbi:hypothetical protein [Nostoc linckia]|nr:hypothetical protein [Nostoc linckia]